MEVSAAEACTGVPATASVHVSPVLTGPTTVTAWVVSLPDATVDEPAGVTLALEFALPTRVTTEPSRTAFAPSAAARPSSAPPRLELPETSVPAACQCSPATGVPEPVKRTPVPAATSAVVASVPFTLMVTVNEAPVVEAIVTTLPDEMAVKPVSPFANVARSVASVVPLV